VVIIQMKSYTLPPPFIDAPAAWRGEEISKRPDVWTRHLSDAEVSELEQAAERYPTKHETIGAITAEEFVLPQLGPFLADLRRTMISGIGFQLVKGVPVERYSLAEAAVLFCGIGAHLGHARSQNAQGHILGHVRDVGADAENPTTRIYQTSQRQTFHTDSADVVGLLCLKDAKRGGDSLLVSTVSVYNEMFRLRPDLATLLFDPIATDRRGEVPEGAKPYFEIPVFNWLDDALTGIYQRQYIDSAQRFDDAPRLTEAHVEALDLSTSSPMIRVFVSPCVWNPATCSSCTIMR